MPTRLGHGAGGYLGICQGWCCWTHGRGLPGPPEGGSWDALWGCPSSQGLWPLTVSSQTGRARSCPGGLGGNSTARAAPALGGDVLWSQDPDAQACQGAATAGTPQPLAERKRAAGESPWAPGFRAAALEFSFLAPPGPRAWRAALPLILGLPPGLDASCRGAGFQADGAKGSLDKPESPRANWDRIPAKPPASPVSLLPAASWAGLGGGASEDLPAKTRVAGGREDTKVT